MTVGNTFELYGDTASGGWQFGRRAKGGETLQIEEVDAGKLLESGKKIGMLVTCRFDNRWNAVDETDNIIKKSN